MMKLSKYKENLQICRKKYQNFVEKIHRMWYYITTDRRKKTYMDDKGVRKMVTVLDVARHILEKQGTMTTMKLQKLCYYVQAWYLAWYESPMFDEDFEAWANGPVCPELFAYHRGKFVISSSDLPKMSQNFTDGQIDTIDKILNYYGDKEPNWLSELTHMERPWKEARKKAGALPGSLCNEIITKDSMLDYYSGL